MAVETQKYITQWPANTLRTRLHYYWMMTWGIIVTAFLTPVQATAHLIRPTARTFQRHVSLWSRAILGGGGIRVSIEDYSGLRMDQPCVFVSNHQNLLDILVIAAALPYPFGFVAKEELKRVPILGTAIQQSACVFLDRSDRRKAVESLKMAGERIRQGNSVLIYAEGSRSFAPELMPFKKGAFILAAEANVPVVPVVVLDAYRLMHEKHKISRGGTIRMVVQPAISPETISRREIPALMEAVREAMEQPLRDHRAEILSSDS
jgi:1-acyl-sn-glycerol-3-phosphate acyltransferase